MLTKTNKYPNKMTHFMLIAFDSYWMHFADCINKLFSNGIVQFFDNP